MFCSFFFSRRRRHTRWPRDWSSDVCSSDLDGVVGPAAAAVGLDAIRHRAPHAEQRLAGDLPGEIPQRDVERGHTVGGEAHPANAAIGTEHLLPELADHPWVLADEQRLEARLEIDLDGLRAAAAKR